VALEQEGAVWNRRLKLQPSGDARLVGFQRVEVLAGSDPTSGRAVATSGLKQDTADWLYVGRIVGNKCQHDLVAAFAIYASHFNSNGEARADRRHL